MAFISIVLSYIIALGIAFLVTGVVLRILGRIKMKRNPYQKPPSVAWVIFLVLGICIIAIPIYSFVIVNLIY